MQFFFYANILDKPRSASNCKHSFVENMNIINQLIPKFLKNNSFGFEVSLMVSQARFTFRADPRSLSNFIKRQSHGLIKLMNWIIFQNMTFMWRILAPKISIHRYHWQNFINSSPKKIMKLLMSIGLNLHSLNSPQTVTVMLGTSLCWWLYDGDSFEMLVAEWLCWRLFSLCWWFSQCIKSVTNILNRSLTSQTCHQHI